MLDIHKNIQSALQKIEQEQHVRILYACESGSRAWGIASADSDFDVRFIYAHETDWYLSLEPGRDVIELPVFEEEGTIYDINGWDLKKALRLVRKGHPVLLEWFSSPIVYRRETTVSEAFKNFFQHANNIFGSFHHYLGMANKNFLRYLDRNEVLYKKYLYSLRPLCACHWLLEKQSLPPIIFEELLDASRIDDRLRREISMLLQNKRTQKESVKGPKNNIIHEFVESELMRLKDLSTFLPKIQKDEILFSETDAFFREKIKTTFK